MDRKSPRLSRRVDLSLTSKTYRIFYGLATDSYEYCFLKLWNAEDKRREYENHIWCPILSRTYGEGLKWENCWRKYLYQLPSKAILRVVSTAHSIERSDYTDWRLQLILLLETDCSPVIQAHSLWWISWRTKSRLITAYFTAEYLMYNPTFKMIQSIVNTCLCELGPQ